VVGSIVFAGVQAVFLRLTMGHTISRAASHLTSGWMKVNCFWLVHTFVRIAHASLGKHASLKAFLVNRSALMTPS
jgi:hypothetical protein